MLQQRKKRILKLLRAKIFITNIAKMLTSIDDIDSGLVRINVESAGAIW